MSDELSPFLPYAKVAKGAVVLGVICLVIALGPFLDSSTSLALRLGVAIPFGAVAAFCFYASLRPPEKHPFIVALRERRQDIVWIYVFRQLVGGVPSQSFLQLGLIDGKNPALAIGLGREDSLLQQLRVLVPLATCGFSPERQAAFKRDPRSLSQGSHRAQ